MMCIIVIIIRRRSHTLSPALPHMVSFQNFVFVFSA